MQQRATSHATSDGERSPALEPAALAPALEVGEGQACGTVDGNGALRTCRDGTYCLGKGPGSVGACTKAPRARPSDA